MQVYQWAAALGPNTYTTTVATFDALQSTPDAGADVGYTFVTTAAPIRPNTSGVVHPALRVSDGGGLAIEDADLTLRQPRSFFADPGLIPAWNADLTKAGSIFQLIPESATTVTLLPPAGGPPRQLVRVRPANLDAGRAGDQMMITENCDGNVSTVIGDVAAKPDPVFGRQIFLGTTVTQQAFRTHFAAIAVTGGGGHPLNTDIPTAAPAVTNSQNAVAAAYGNALAAVAGGAANPALTAGLRVLGINEYARPTRIGQGLHTTSLGVDTAGMGGVRQVTDHTNNGRVLTHPVAISAVMWGSHWGGVVAVDGTDYVTLENYSRTRETSTAVSALAQPTMAAVNESLYYVQMYGANRSWHTQWATPSLRGKQFADALTYLVQPAQRRPMQYYVADSKNAHAAVAAATTLMDLQRALLNALNYANMHRYADDPAARVADRTRLGRWRQAVAAVVNNPPGFAAGPQPVALAAHVQTALADVTSS